jgi:hypothetical protein
MPSIGCRLMLEKEKHYLGLTIVFATLAMLAYFDLGMNSGVKDVVPITIAFVGWIFSHKLAGMKRHK